MEIYSSRFNKGYSCKGYLIVLGLCHALYLVSLNPTGQDVCLSAIRGCGEHQVYLRGALYNVLLGLGLLLKLTHLSVQVFKLLLVIVLPVCSRDYLFLVCFSESDLCALNGTRIFCINISGVWFHLLWRRCASMVSRISWLCFTQVLHLL